MKQYGVQPVQTSTSLVPLPDCSPDTFTYADILRHGAHACAVGKRAKEHATTTSETGWSRLLIATASATTTGFPGFQDELDHIDRMFRNDSDGRGRVVVELRRLQIRSLNDIATGCAEVREVLERARNLDDPALVWEGLTSLCWHLHHAGLLGEAVDIGQQALQLARDTPLPFQEVISLSDLGSLLAGLQDHDGAIQLLEQASARCRMFDRDSRIEMLIQNNLGEALRHAGRLQEALDTFLRAAVISQGAGLDEGIGFANFNAAVVQMELGHIEAAKVSIHECTRAWNRLPPAQIPAYRILAEAISAELTSSWTHDLVGRLDRIHDGDFSMGWEFRAKLLHLLGSGNEALGDFQSSARFFRMASTESERLWKAIGAHSTHVIAKALHTREAMMQAEEERRKREEIDALYAEVTTLNDKNRILIEMLEHRSRELAHLALIDGLTGLPNRRSFYETLETWDTARHGTCSVGIFDVDDFKLINDRFTHLIGDNVLRRIGILASSVICDNITAARIGGEEFALFWPSPEFDRAKDMLEDLRKKILNESWDAIAPDLHVTISAGIASSHEGASTRDVLALADQRMYIAKKRGKNQVVGS